MRLSSFPPRYIFCAILLVAGFIFLSSNYHGALGSHFRRSTSQFFFHQRPIHDISEFENQTSAPTAPQASIITTATTVTIDAPTETATATVTLVPLALPIDYSPNSSEAETFCHDRFDVDFLYALNSSVEARCLSAPQQTTCFHIHTTGERIDSACMSGPITFSNTSRKFRLDCEDNGTGLRGLQSYWYNTGPGIVYNELFVFEPEVPHTNDLAYSLSSRSDESDGYILLIKREGPENLWHTLMQVFAATMTLDVLSFALDPTDSTPLIPSGSLDANLRIIIADSHPEGPFWDLWSALSPLPLLRLNDADSIELNNKQVIVPLAGGANQFWQGDWDVLECHGSELLDAFVARVLRVLSLSRPSPNANKPVRVTYVQRAHRDLVSRESHIAALRSTFSDIEIVEEEFSSMALTQQVAIAQQTDVLVGVHGAGLTHSMFLPKGAAMVEILPEGLKHKGFRNTAHLRELTYFSVHGRAANPGNDWHGNDVVLEEDLFIEVVDAAIDAVRNVGMRNEDIQ